MPNVLIAEGGRWYPEYPCGPDWNDVCGPDDVDAWGRRLTAEIHGAHLHLAQLSPAGEWMGSAAPALAAEISTWMAEAREWADTDHWHTPVGFGHSAAYGGFEGVVQEVAGRIDQGINLNNRARLMIWDHSQKPAPDPKPLPESIVCPEGYTAVLITQTDGSIIQFCQGAGPQPVHQDDLPDPNVSSAGTSSLVLLGLAAGLGALTLYSKRGTISSSVLRNFRK